MLTGESKTPHFYDFGTSGRVPGSQNQLCLSSETPRHLNKNKNSPQRCLVYMIFIKFETLEVQHFDNVGKDGRKTIEDPSNNILKIFDMRAISIQKHEMGTWQHVANIF